MGTLQTMQSLHFSAAPAALQRWAPLERGGRKLMGNGRTLGSARGGSALVGRGRAASAALAVEEEDGTSEQRRERRERRERRVAGGNGSIAGRSGPGETEQKVQVEKVLRTGRVSTLDYIDLVSEFSKEDGGPPRWFCPAQKGQEAPAPLLLSLPGLLGAGSGLLFHYESLGRLFELRCLHIPNVDRTPFEGLVSLVEDTVREEAKQHPGRPIYLLGDDFGGALALAVAARNTQLHLILILLNPSTSFDKSVVANLQPFLPVLQALPAEMFAAAPFLLGLLLGDPQRLSSSKFASSLPTIETPQEVSNIVARAISAMQELLSSLSKETLLWKLQILSSGAKYVNQRLQDVKADVLVLASIEDRFLPSLDEARRLTKTLPHCTHRKLEQTCHCILLGEDFDLASTIKKTGMYHRAATKDPVADFVLPTEEEIEKLYDSQSLYRTLLSPVFFSTGEDGKVVEGLAKIPSPKGPLLFVGNHSLLGLDMKTIASTLIKERQIYLRGLAHPVMFKKEHVEEQGNVFDGDLGRLFGALPVNGKDFFKMLARGDSVALYPGGAREACHLKGEAHKVFWPDQPEFVKMAARFGATIIPMCAVGEDDLFEIVLDYNDLMDIPVVKSLMEDAVKEYPQLRADGAGGEVATQPLHMPLVVPNVGELGRMYILFGKPMHLEGKREYFRDPKNVRATYEELKGELEGGIDYLLRKREDDPYRRFFPRIFYEMSSGQAPSFKPE